MKVHFHLTLEVNSFPNGKNYFISTNSLSYGDNQFNYHNPSVDNISKCQAYISTEDTLTHDIVISGNFKLESGNVIKITVNKTGAEDNVSDPIDKMQTGKYLITSIIHTFSDEYTMQVELKTNSFGADLNDIITLEEEKDATEVSDI